MTPLSGQTTVSPVTPMMVDRADDASTAKDATGGDRSITWLYATGTPKAWVSATGQAAATICVARLAYKGIMNALKVNLGGQFSTSFVFAATTRFDTFVAIDEEVFSSAANMSPADQAILFATFFNINGQYTIDHRRSLIIGRAKAVVADDTVDFSYSTPLSSTAPSPAADIGNVQSLAADTTVSGTVSATNGAGGTTIVAINALRSFIQCQNNGGVDVYFGAGTVTSSFLRVVPNGLFTWNSKEALKVLSSGAACNIAFTDYSNS